MRVSQLAHVLYLALDSDFGLGLVDNGLRYELHCDFVSGHRVHGHCEIAAASAKDFVCPGSCNHVLLTLPNVPSAMSCITVYSPSFEGGSSVAESLGSFMVVESSKAQNAMSVNLILVYLVSPYVNGPALVSVPDPEAPVPPNRRLATRKPGMGTSIV